MNNMVENFEDFITDDCSKRVMKGWDEKKELLDALPKLNKEFERCSEEYYTEV